ncbi:MAG: ribonuclease D [Kiloniellales bacterium]
MPLISDSAELAAFCERQAEAEFIAVDTEFMRDTTYWPKLCLVQIGGPKEVAAIDSLAPGIDLQPLYDLMADFRLLKVFHSGRQDLEIFYHLTGAVPESIFDTQVAAMVCGFGDSVSYEQLARKLAGARIDKSSRFADWSKRPLTERQLDYALADVTHLRRIFTALRRRLEKNGRSDWLQDEMDVLTDPRTYDLEPRQAWRRFKSRSTDRRFLAVLRELAAWREAEAQRRDVPRNRVIRDEQLLDIAAHQPTDAEALGRTRGLSRDFAQGRWGREVLKAVKAGLEVPDKELPDAPPAQKLPQGIGPLTDLLKVLLKMRCEQYDVAQKLVASAADLELIAADDKADVRALDGWRYEIFGADALALKHGKLALSASRRKVKVVPLD